MTSPLPHSRESEAAVLAGIMLRNDTIHDVAAAIGDDAFYLPSHAAIWRAMLRLSEAGKPIDPVTLEYDLRGHDELGLVGGLEGLGLLSGHWASSANVRHHAAQLREQADVRALAKLGRELADVGADPIADPKAFVADATARISALTAGQTIAGDLTQIGRSVYDAFKEITDRAKSKIEVTGIPTGFVDFDALTSGMQAGDLVLLAARPSMGKTAMALNILRHACVPRFPDADAVAACTPGVVFSLEMTTSQLIERMLCDGAQVDSQKLRVGKVIESEFRDLVRHADLLHRAPIWVDSTSGQKIDDMRRKVSRLRKRGAIPKDGKLLIVVDYLQLCRGGKKKYDSREQEISDISQGLKNMAKDENGVVLALSQLGRDVDKRPDHTPQLADLRESGTLEQDADTIAFIVRRERYVADEAERKELEGKAELIIGKQRKGPTGTVHLTYRGKYTRFENAAADDIFGAAA